MNAVAKELAPEDQKVMHTEMAVHLTEAPKHLQDFWEEMKQKMKSQQDQIDAMKATSSQASGGEHKPAGDADAQV